MDKEKRATTKIILLLAATVVLLAGGVALGIGVGRLYAAQARESAKPTCQTFADYTERETLQTVPALVTDHTRMEEARDYGEGTYGVVVDGATLADYRA